MRKAHVRSDTIFTIVITFMVVIMTYGVLAWLVWQERK